MQATYTVKLLSKGTTAMQDAIEALLTAEPITAREMADKSGATMIALAPSCVRS